jgi:hypothetical protein
MKTLYLKGHVTIYDAATFMKKIGIIFIAAEFSSRI